MIAKIKAIDERGSRDTNQELIQSKLREVYQKKKSGAILQFEIVLSKMLKEKMQTSTISVLKGVKKPIFNKGYEQFIDQLSRYYQTEVVRGGNEVTKDKNGIVQKKSSNKLVFMPTFTERLNMDQTQTYNTEAEIVQTNKTEMEAELKTAVLNRITALVRRPTRMSTNLMKS